MTPVEGCTKCWCGCKYWYVEHDARSTCAGCGEDFKERDYVLDEDGIPQVTLDGVSTVW